MNKKINFIVLYFGEFPNYMQLFLNSCKKNSEFHWTILTDNKRKYVCPPNVKIINSSFEEIQRKIQDKFDFPISLETPYKFCDYKPMYGYLFPELNAGYDFWGYCDLDIIMGDLSKYITDKVLEYNKIFTLGHMTIMHNTELMNTLFMQTIDEEKYYKKVLTSSLSYNFDEDFLDRFNINSICRMNNIRIWEKSCIADIYTKSSDFRRVLETGVEKRSKNYFVWINGKLIRRIKRGNIWNTDEFMYIHLQKRHMKIKMCDLANKTIFKIIPNEFSELEIDVGDIGEKDELVKTKKFNLQYIKIRLKNLKVKARMYIRNENSSLKY